MGVGMSTEVRSFLIGVVAALLGIVINAWIFSMIWDALATEFPDMPHIDFWAAVGILMLVGIVGAAFSDSYAAQQKER